MIAWLKGLIIDKDIPGRLVLNVNGVGYDIETSLSTFFAVENQSNSVELFIQTIVREDAFLLYGFQDKSERQLFRELIKVNGVGPKLAITILSGMPPEQFILCIENEDVSSLVKMPGVGRKTAERLVVEMKDKLKDFMHYPTSSTITYFGNSAHDIQASDVDAISALEALGYKSHDAKKAVSKVKDINQSVEQIIRLALRELA